MALTKEEQEELELLRNDPELGYLVKKPTNITGVETSMPEAFARSSAQGFTFDTADEIAAALEAATTSKPYKQALEESRQEYEAAQQQYPITSALGGIGGGIAQAALLTGLTGGAAAPAEAAAVAGKGSKALQLLRSALVPTVGEGALANIASAGKVGAAMGGLTALGASEEEGLDRLKDLPGGIGVGAAGGAIGGTVAEGLGAAGGAIGKKISQKIDEGKLPDFFKQVRSGWNLGERELGTITPKDKSIIRDQAINLSEKFMEPIDKITQDAGILKNKIYNNIVSRIDLRPEVNGLVSQLKKLGRTKSIKLADEIERLYLLKLKQFADSKGNVTLGDWEGFRKEVEEILSTKKANSIGLVRKLKNDYVYDLMKSKIENAADAPTALAGLARDREALELYSKYIKKLTPKELLGLDAYADDFQEPAAVLSQNLKGISKMEGVTPFSVNKDTLAGSKRYGMKKEEAELHAANINNLVDIIKDIAEKEGISIPIETMRDEIKNILEQSSSEVVQNINPIKKLNEIISRVRTSSEFMGVERKVGVQKSPVKDFDDLKKILQNVLKVSDDRESNIANQIKYKKAMEYLRKDFPDLADNIETQIGKAVDDLQFLRYTQEGSLDTPIKEAGIIKSAMGNIGQYFASGSNLLSQTLTAAQKGEAGIIPGTSTVIRPGVSALNSIKKRIDRRIEVSPSPVLETLSEMIDRALAEKDAGRRAAMLNTLMQYGPIRDMMKAEPKK